MILRTSLDICAEPNNSFSNILEINMKFSSAWTFKIVKDRDLKRVLVSYMSGNLCSLGFRVVRASLSYKYVYTGFCND